MYGMKYIYMYIVKILAIQHTRKISLLPIKLENVTALGERRSPHTVLHNIQDFTLLPNLTFKLQLVGYVCVLTPFRICHLLWNQKAGRTIYMYV